LFFNELVNALNLPIGWSNYLEEKTLVFYKPVYKINKLVIEKQIVINDNVNVNFYVNNELIEPASLGLIQLTYPINTKNLSEVINSFNYKQVCQGGPMAINFPGNKFIVLYYIIYFIRVSNIYFLNINITTNFKFYLSRNIHYNSRKY